MSIRFFKKPQPRVKLCLADGSQLQFENVDNTTGIFASDNANILSGIDRMMSEGRGGIDEITGEDFRLLTEKKKSGQGSSKPWREEISNMALQKHSFQVPVALEGSGDRVAGVHVAPSVAQREAIPGLPASAQPAEVPTQLRPTASKK